MSKFEFITETNTITGGVRYYTEKDGDYVDSSISADKDSAYEKFIKAKEYSREQIHLLALIKDKIINNNFK